MKTNEQMELYAEQVQQLYAASPIGSIAAMVNAPLVAFALWNVTPHQTVLVWLSCIIAITLLRYALVFTYSRTRVAPDQAHRWEMLSAVSMFLSGLAWGSVVIVLFPDGSLAHQVFLAFVLGGMVAGATSVHAISKKSFFAYSIPVLLPLTIRFFFVRDDIHISMGVLLAVFSCLMIATALRVHKTMIMSLKLRFENKSLLAYLACAKDQAEALNKKLIAEIEERERAEAELKMYQENLELRVAERTAELRDVNKQLLREIDERRRSENELRAAKDFLENVFRTSGDGLLVTDDQGYIIKANDSAVRFFGYADTELTGMHMAELSPDNHAIGNDPPLIHQLLKEGFVNDYQSEYKRKDGTLFSADVNTMCMKDKEGKLIGAISSIRDISDRKNAEKEKQKLVVQLQNAHKMEAIGTLAGGVAHDLNNILSAMIGYPELLLLKLSEDSPLRNPLLSIKASGEKAAAIVHDMLTLARRGVNISEVLNLNTVITEYLGSQEHQKLQDFHPVTVFEQSLAPDLLNIIGSPVHLSKTVMNLIVNAAEAVSDGGKVIIATENRYLDKPVKGYEKVNKGEHVVLSVQDNGIGISEDNLARIFEPFYTKKVMGRSGTGLGLSVVWGTVEDHKGYIDVETDLGEGTTFKLYFPATRREVKDKKTLPLEKYVGNGETVLVVDDVESQREIASSILTTLNYHVATVPSGEDAVVYLQTQPVDLVVLDMIMDPGMDGLETYKKILAIRPHQKAIIASGFSETDRVQEAQRLGAGAYIKKPYTIEKIGMAVKNELAKKA